MHFLVHHLSLCCHYYCTQYNSHLNIKKYSRIKIHNHNWPSSLIPSSSELAVLMVKQNKAKVSKSKWVFLLNVIALGMAGDGYWSASSLAITVGMAISRPVGFSVNNIFSSHFRAEYRLRAVECLKKTIPKLLLYCGNCLWKVSVIHTDGRNVIVSLLDLGCGSRYMPMGHLFLYTGGIYKGKCWPWLHKRSKRFLLIQAVLTGWDIFFSPYKTIKWDNEFWLEG